MIVVDRGERDQRSAATFPTPAECIVWLHADAPTLGGAQQSAVEEAASNDPLFAAAWVEKVE